MIRYLGTRALSAIPVLIGVSVLVFLMLYLIPGDPVDALLGPSGTMTTEERQAARTSLGLDDPLPVQYARYASGVLRGDLGRSLATRRPVAEEIARQLPSTLQLTAAAMTVAVLLGFSLGTLAATRPGTVWDSGVMLVALGGISMPGFWLATLLLLVFSLWLGWLPSSGSEGVERLVMPAVALGYGAAAVIARLVRSSLLEVFHQDFLRTARAKGLTTRAVVLRHALRNALIPVLTLIGVQVGVLLANAVIVETVFSRQGLGRLLVQGLSNRDFPLVQGIVLFIAGTYVLINLAVDLAYVWIDPRIRYSE